MHNQNCDCLQCKNFKSNETEATFYIQMNDGKTSYQISKEDYFSIKCYLECPKLSTTPATYDLKQKQHDKLDKTWETRTIVLSQVLSLNRVESEEIEEPKNGRIFIIPENDKILDKLSDYIIKVTEKDYKWWLENHNNLGDLYAGERGIPVNMSLGDVKVGLLGITS